ncbi:uncharacterized protein RCO7_02270 [Rhynchosporium graminicola]|uniref:Uncharacterized protein n=1 Tax=Rhynchosporium graminicola TaxID=2792576 RepID=A0A1E1LDK1_9HELO|nr:uncharacterized protein RCO7_02270 [Rhynchosporium commune]
MDLSLTGGWPSPTIQGPSHLTGTRQGEVDMYTSLPIEDDTGTTILPATEISTFNEYEPYFDDAFMNMDIAREGHGKEKVRLGPGIYPLDMTTMSSLLDLNSSMVTVDGTYATVTTQNHMDTTKGSLDYGRDRVKIELPSAGDHYRRGVSEDLLQSRHLSRLELQSDSIRGLPCIYNNFEPVSEPDSDGDAPRVMPEIVHGENPRHIPVSVAKPELLSTASSAGLSLLDLSSSAPSSTGQYSCNTTTPLATPSGAPTPARLARGATPATTSFTSSRVIDGVDPGDGHLGVTSRAAPVCIRLLMLYIKSRGIENGQLAEDLVAQDKWYLSGVKEALRIRARFHGRIHSRRSSTASRQPSFQFPTSTSHQTCDSQAPLTAAPLAPAAVTPGTNEHNTPNEGIHGQRQRQYQSFANLPANHQQNRQNQLLGFTNSWSGQMQPPATSMKRAASNPAQGESSATRMRPNQQGLPQPTTESQLQMQQAMRFPLSPMNSERSPVDTLTGNSSQLYVPERGTQSFQNQQDDASYYKMENENWIPFPGSSHGIVGRAGMSSQSSQHHHIDEHASMVTHNPMYHYPGQQGQVSGQFGQFENNYIVPSGDGCNAGGRAM